MPFPAANIKNGTVKDLNELQITAEAVPCVASASSQRQSTRSSRSGALPIRH
jgi:hypothetical protein